MCILLSRDSGPPARSASRRDAACPRLALLSSNLILNGCPAFVSFLPFPSPCLLAVSLSSSAVGVGKERRAGGLPGSPVPGLGLSCCGSGAVTSLGSSGGGCMVHILLQSCPSSWPHSLPARQNHHRALPFTSRAGSSETLLAFRAREACCSVH